MLKTLVKKQLMEIFRSYFYDAKKNQRRSTLSTALFIVFFVLIMVGLLGGIFTFLSHYPVRCNDFCRHGLAVLRAHGADGHIPRRVRQRFQHLFQPVHRQG